MNILIRIPNWLGDAVMATFALEILYKTYPQAHFYIVGSIVSGELFRHYPNTTIIFDKSKQSKYRLLNLYHLAKKIPRCDLAFTFQNNFLSALFLAFNRSKKRIGYSNQVRSIFLHIAPKRPKNTHEVLRFSQLVETIVPNHHLPPKLYLKKPKTLPKKLSQKLAGINAGAAFGSAKRWKEEYFAQVIAFLLKEDFTIFLFGTESEGVINQKILSFLPNSKNLIDLSGQTSIQELMSHIATLDLFLTNDSGSMHIAACFEIPTLTIFGPTDDTETSPFHSKNASIISLKTLHKPLPCQPCKKRICPLPKNSPTFHACMIDLKPESVIEKLQLLLTKIPQKEDLT